MRNARWIVLFALSGVLSTWGAAPPEPATGGCPPAFNAYYWPGHPADLNGDDTVCVWRNPAGTYILKWLQVVIDNR